MDYLEFLFSGKGNISHILYSNHEHNRIECFINTDWAGSKEDKRSTLGYCVFVGGI